MIQDQTLECDWNVLLNYANSLTEKNRVRSLNRLIPVSAYPLTRDYLNQYYVERGSPFQRSYIYDCAASMYSFFVQFYGKTLESGSGSGVPANQTAGMASTGFFPTGLPFGLDLSLLPWWLWVLLIGGGIIFIKNKID